MNFQVKYACYQLKILITGSFSGRNVVVESKMIVLFFLLCSSLTF